MTLTAKANEIAKAANALGARIVYGSLRKAIAGERTPSARIAILSAYNRLETYKHSDNLPIGYVVG